MMPQYEIQKAIIRDTRGIQMLDLMTGTSHQLFLTPYETNQVDLRFLQVLFDEESQKYTIVTIHKSDTKEEEAAGVGFAEHLAK